MHVFEELKRRDSMYAVTDDALADALEKNEMTFYLGIDPTGESMHVGHLAVYMLARRLQAAGHRPILLVGGGTGLIGDPSGKSEERTLLDLEETLAYGERIATQIRRLVPQAQIVNNYDWLKTYDILTFLRDIGKHFGINAMLAKDSVRSRLETGISFTEFSYQIVQALDFLHLYKTHDCTLQIGAQDQWGNITAGLDLIRKVCGPASKAYAMVIPLLTRPDGTKFGKTAGEAVWLDAEKTSPYAFYQFWINQADADIVSLMKRFSEMPLSDIETLAAKAEEAPHLRIAQKTLAEEMTALVHGQKALEQAKNITEALFENALERLSEAELEMGFAGVKSATLSDSMSLVDALVELGLAPSKREARTLIANRAITVNGERETDDTCILDARHALYGRFTVVRRGKKEYGVLKRR